MLSVVITAWNEEKNLPRVVSSVRGLADEIVVVDTESTDRTVETARRLGCRVYRHKYPGIVEPVRNFSLTKARGDWILLLDADEEVGPELKRHIKTLLAAPQADYYRLPRQNIIFGRKITSRHWWPDYVHRLFRPGFVVWNEAIHSVPFTRGVGADLPAADEYALIHHHYDSVSQYVTRLNRYTDYQLQQLVKEKVRFSPELLLTKPVQEFLTQYFARRGYADGLHGLALAGLQAFSELTLCLKLWQQTGFVPQPLSPARATRILAEQAREYRWWHYQVRIESSRFPASLYWKLCRYLRARQILPRQLSGIISRLTD